ncbi:M3 peptidase [Helicosporidium sp. ATCC 50920]|nr:M3 peptidase [Helicosporidium sp. ATCC 50920]|eukprot:KDD73435.1 M3 peptidase [Helicosporidium sp. ATCC 50920]
MSASPKVNMEALEEAERIMSNSTLSQSDCVALLNNVTTKFRLWDASFWAHRLDASQNSTEQNPGGEPEDFRNYFTLSRVLSGAFALLNRLWGMHVVESVHDKPQVWHPDVRHYRLFNDSQLLGSFFFDPYARPNKSSASRTYSLVKRSEVHDHWPNKVRYPVAVMVTSIVPPESGKPALLDIMDVQNLFHELGHVIQHLVNQESQALIAGTTTLPLDLFEMFATFYELWATEDSILRMMAQDYKTHALLTADKQKRLMQAVRRTRPLLTLEQLYFAKMDLSLHLDYKANATETIFTHRQKVANDTLLIPYSTNNCDFCSLVHTFGHQYASTYYSYLWSETHASDAMGYFEEMGISNDTQVRALGNKMAAVLLNDGMSSTDAESQYVKFRGRPVSKEHFVKHLVF